MFFLNLHLQCFSLKIEECKTQVAVFFLYTAVFCIYTRCIQIGLDSKWGGGEEEEELVVGFRV